MARYVALFNQRDWDGLRALLADDVKLNQSSHPLRVGRADVGLFFTIYAKIDGVSLAPAWLEGREVIAVFEDRADPKPSYMMWLEWRDGRISFIRDYRYVRYVTADAELAWRRTPSRAKALCGDSTCCGFLPAPFQPSWRIAKDVTPAGGAGTTHRTRSAQSPGLRSCTQHYRSASTHRVGAVAAAGLASRANPHGGWL